MTEQGVLVVASVRDITERRRAEEELLQAQERFRLVVEGVRDRAILMLDPAGRVSTWSAGATRLVGYEEEGWRVRKDGTRLWASVVVTAIRDQTGKLLGFAKITRDVTERKRQDDRLRAVLEVAQATAVAIDYARVREDLQRLAVREDRERIGRELHDGAIQALFAVGMGLKGMAIMTADPLLRERLEAAVGQVDDVIRDLRNSIFGLRPGLAADRHLGRALQELGEQLEQQHGVACAVQVEQTVAARLAGQAADIVQAAREALFNVGRHASAATCRLSLREEPGFAVLEVEDDGRGFVPGEGRRWLGAAQPGRTSSRDGRIAGCRLGARRRDGGQPPHPHLTAGERSGT